METLYATKEKAIKRLEEVAMEYEKDVRENEGIFEIKLEPCKGDGAHKNSIMEFVDTSNDSFFIQLIEQEKTPQERIVSDIAGFVESCPSSKNYLSYLPRDLINYIANDLTITEKLNLAFSCELLDKKLHTPKRVNPFISNKLLHLTDFGKRCLCLERLERLEYPNVPNIRKNRWDNLEELNSHIVFDKITLIVIGYQNDDGKVAPLKQEHIDFCEEREWKYLH